MTVIEQGMQGNLTCARAAELLALSPRHHLEEDEFFDLGMFSSRGDFLAKTHTSQLYFNLVRPNSHKGNLSPWQIIE